MNSKITFKNNNKVISNDIFDLNFSQKNISESENLFDFKALNGKEKVISYEGIHIYFGELSTNGKVNFDINYEMPFMMVNFEIEGGYNFIPSDKKKTQHAISINQNHYNCIYSPNLKGVLNYTSEKRKYFTLFISETYILDILNTKFKETSQSYIKLINDKKTFSLFNKSKKIPYTQLRIIEDIVNCYYNNEIKTTYIKSKIIEIFAHIFFEATKPDLEHSQKDKQLAYKAEKFILANFSKDITLDLISKEIGTNKTKLKYLFKEVYGETVISFRLRIRMEKAKKLLQQNYSISEIAYAIGYKNPQHFTSAFKKQFKCLPSVFKKESGMLNPI